MKNVKKTLLISSLFINFSCMALVVKFWPQIRDAVTSQSETKPAKAALKEPQTDPGKIYLKEAILEQRNEIENCYDDYLGREPEKANGSIAVRWEIDAEGKVQNPQIADAEIKDDVLKDCVVQQVSQMTFDPDKFGEAMQFSYRFHFKARAPASIKFE